MSFTISELLQQLANGLTLGSLYALVAIGYTMVYGILRLINFAHGDIFMMSMYFAFYAISVFYLPWYIAVVLVILATGLLGVIIERCAYKPLRDAPRISLMISSIGVSYLLENLAIVLFTQHPAFSGYYHDRQHPYAEINYLGADHHSGNRCCAFVFNQSYQNWLSHARCQQRFRGCEINGYQH